MAKPAWDILADESYVLTQAGRLAIRCHSPTGADSVQNELIGRWHAAVCQEAKKSDTIGRWQRLNQDLKAARTAAEIAKARTDEVEAKKKALILLARPGFADEVLELESKLPDAAKQLEENEQRMRVLRPLLAEAEKAAKAELGEIAKRKAHEIYTQAAGERVKLMGELAALPDVTTKLDQIAGRQLLLQRWQSIDMASGDVQLAEVPAVGGVS